MCGLEVSIFGTGTARCGTSPAADPDPSVDPRSTCGGCSTTSDGADDPDQPGGMSTFYGVAEAPTPNSRRPGPHTATGATTAATGDVGLAAAFAGDDAGLFDRLPLTGGSFGVTVGVSLAMLGAGLTLRWLHVVGLRD